MSMRTTAWEVMDSVEYELRDKMGWKHAGMAGVPVDGAFSVDIGRKVWDDSARQTLSCTSDVTFDVTEASIRLSTRVR